MKPKFRISRLSLVFTSGVVLATSATAQTARQWTGSSGGAWLTTTNWTGGIWAGDAPNANPAGEGTATDIFTTAATNSATNIGINMNTLSAAGGVGLILGGIDFNKTNTATLQIGNSSTSVNGIMQLDGASINSVSNTLIRVAGSANLTIANVNSGSGSQTMGLRLGITNGIMDVGSSRTLTISSIISEANANSSITRTGAGTLTLSGDNTFTGGVTSTGLGTLALQHSNAAGTGTISFATTLPSNNTNATFTVSGGINVANNIVIDAESGRNTINSIGTGTSNTLSGNITINNTAGNFISFQNRAGNGTTFTIGGATPNSTTITASDFASTLSFRAETNTTTALGVINSQIIAPNATFNLNNDAFFTVNSTGNTWAATTMSTGNNRIQLGAHDALATGARLYMGATSTGFVDLNGFNQAVAGLAGSTIDAQIKNDSTTSDSTLTLAGLSANRSFSGVITNGSGGRTTSLVFDNANAFTQTLSGANT
jgi:autotransporter-associated beta strand protein